MLDLTYSKPNVSESHLKMLAVLGTAVHHGIATGKMQEELKPYAQAQKKYLREYDLKSRRREFIVKSLRYWYAGTADDSLQDSKGYRVLTDYKSGSFQARYSAQINLYDMADAEARGCTHDILHVVTLNADGSYKVKEVIKDWGLGIKVVSKYYESLQGGEG